MLETAAESAQGQVKITDIKAMQVGRRTWIKIETDAGLIGYGPCGSSGILARDVIAGLEEGRLPHLGLIGKDPLAIQVHFHNMFYAYPQRGRQVRVLSGIDIRLNGIVVYLIPSGSHYAKGHEKGQPGDDL